MKVIDNPTKDLFLLAPIIMEDDRGYFYESFKESWFKENISYPIHFIQENESKSKKNVFRGFHYQEKEAQQSKLLRVISGSIIDYCIDLRENSPSKGKLFSFALHASNKYQLFIPKGFAHGFYCLEDVNEVQYKVDHPYVPEKESGIHIKHYFSQMHLDTPLETICISPKDQNLP